MAKSRAVPQDPCNQIRETLEKARQKLIESKELEPEELEREVETAETSIARLRDCLIEELRKAAAGERKAIRESLDHVNVALSLVVGIEYPARGITRQLLDEAEKVLEQVTV